VVFLCDDRSEFDVPIDAVWAFLDQPDRHSVAHRHRDVRRDRKGPTAGEYSWEQEFDGRPTRFTMRWTSFPPVGVAYDVRDGPFAGSRFFLYYTPRGARTGVTVVGEFVSPTLSEAEIPGAVDRFFSLEFEQDHAALRESARPADRPRGRPPGGSRRTAVRRGQ
jgi:hypothetical protein